MWIGCLAYANDATLVSPTLYGMQKMLDICTAMAKENDVIQ